ncbi:hypothetical protein Tco_0821435 [Tanacetum coccineum]|uniref:Uncharacterized protein n=1 Tax=Tanacetum coccineum TaxID=301880 RepID=A0ABQ5AD49_9ASTR
MLEGVTFANDQKAFVIFIVCSEIAMNKRFIGKQTAHSFALFAVVTVAILRFQYDALLMLMVDWLTLSNRVVQDALDKANLAEVDLSAIVVTIAPGLSLCVRDRFECLLTLSLQESIVGALGLSLVRAPAVASF